MLNIEFVRSWTLYCHSISTRKFHAIKIVLPHGLVCVILYLRDLIFLLNEAQALPSVLFRTTLIAICDFCMFWIVSGRRYKMSLLFILRRLIPSEIMWLRYFWDVIINGYWVGECSVRMNECFDNAFMVERISCWVHASTYKHIFVGWFGDVGLSRKVSCLWTLI